MEQKQEQTLKNSPSKEQGEEADDVSGNPDKKVIFSEPCSEVKCCFFLSSLVVAEYTLKTIKYFHAPYPD